MKIYIHIDNLNWYSLSMNIYGTTQNSREKEGHPLFFLNIHELYSYILLNKIIMFIYIPDT